LLLLLEWLSSTITGAKRLGCGLTSFPPVSLLTSFDDLTLCSTGSGAKRLGFAFSAGASFDDLVVSSTGCGAKRRGFFLSSSFGSGCREDLVVCSIGVGANLRGGLEEDIGGVE
jgi:hypothetical protein